MNLRPSPLPARTVAAALVAAMLLACGTAYGTTPVTALMTPVATDTVLPVDMAAPARPAPVLVVRSYKTSVERVLVGSRFTLTLAIHNATARKAENVVVSLAASPAAGGEALAGSGGLTVLGTGNAKYAGTVKGGATSNVAFDVMAGPGTSPGAYAIPVTVSFEYNGERQEVGYTVGVVVERDASFAVVTAEYPKTARPKEPFDASFEVANTGGFAVNGVTLSVESSSATVADGSLYLGTFDAAGAEAIDVSVTPEKAGPLELTLVVSYRDDFGRARTYRQTYKVQVEEVSGTDAGAPGGPEAPAADKEGPGGFVGFILALLGLGS